MRQNPSPDQAAVAPRHALLQALLARLSEATGQAPERLALQLRPPPKPELGDYAWPCFELAKERKVAPAALASQLAERLSGDAALWEWCEEVSAAGPFLNFRARPGRLCAAVLEAIRAAGVSRYGRTSEGRGRTVVVDYSSPNIAKPFHLGHLMSTVLGASLARIFRAQGCTVIGVNHLGDWGTQCGYQFLAWRRADPAERERRLAAEGLDYLAELYVEINAPAKRVAALEERNRELPPGSSETRATLEAELAQVRPEAENLDAEARALFRRLEDGDPELRALWERFRKTTLEVLQKSYDRLGVRFESDAGEGFYEPFLKPLIAELKARGVLEQSEGAWVIALDEPGAERKRPPFIVVKSDGATKYEARDLAAALYRKRQYDFAQNLYVVDVRQSEHFKNLFRALEKCGHAWAKDCHHVSYGMMKIKEGDSVLPMTTRGGRMIPLQELLDRMRDIVRRIVEEKNPELPAARKDAVAEAVGVGAIVFWIQSRRRDSHILFDWRQATNPDGDTGPYVQYTHARACSILRKAEAQPACAEASAGRSACASGAAGRPPPSLELSLLVQPEETAVAKELERFPAVLREAAENYEPSMIGGWLIVVSRAFNDFYHRRQVLKAETPELRAARLALVDCMRGLLAQGLSLLGMAAPEEM